MHEYVNMYVHLGGIRYIEIAGPTSTDFQLEDAQDDTPPPWHVFYHTSVRRVQPQWQWLA
jgi:hypothetical protein